MAIPFAITDLRQCPQFLDVVAHRVWQAWWEPKGTPLEHIAARTRENMADTPTPFALVAHDGATFLGTASVIAADLEERPQLTPWVAAVWVEPHIRGRGVGAALVDRATRDCFALGVARVYLCARQPLLGFYSGLGWKLIERDVGPRRLDIFVRAAAMLSSRQ